MRPLLMACALLAGCGDAMMMQMASGYAGYYEASYTGTYDNTMPFPMAGTNSETGHITVSDEPGNMVKLTWEIGTNPASGIIVFTLTGSSGPGITGTCATGKLSNGNTQTTCCKTCSVTFNGKMLVQNQQGDYTGVTPQSIAYSGTYSGTWTATKLER
jgi:hypothetical protein